MAKRRTTTIGDVSHDPALDRPMSPAMRRKLGLAIRGLRVSQDLDQEDVAKRSGLCVGTIAALESNRYPARRETIARVLHVFGTTVDALLRGTLQDPRTEGLTNEDLTIARMYHNCSTQARLDVVERMKRDAQPQPFTFDAPSATAADDDDDDDPLVRKMRATFKQPRQLTAQR